MVALASLYTACGGSWRAATPSLSHPCSRAETRRNETNVSGILLYRCAARFTGLTGLTGPMPSYRHKSTILHPLMPPLAPATEQAAEMPGWRSSTPGTVIQRTVFPVQLASLSPLRHGTRPSDVRSGHTPWTASVLHSGTVASRRRPGLGVGLGVHLRCGGFARVGCSDMVSCEAGEECRNSVNEQTCLWV